MIQRGGDNASSGASLVLNIVMPILVFGAGIGIFAGLMILKKEPAEADTGSKVPIVSTAVAEKYDGNIEIEVSGIVVPYREIAITAQVDGIVLEKTEACEAGRPVKAGTLLLQIDPENYELEVERLTAESAQASGALAELAVEVSTTQNKIKLAERQKELRERELKRFTDLGDSGARSGRDLDQAEWNKLNAEIELTAQQDKLRLLQKSEERLQNAKKLVDSQLRRAELDLKRCNMVAPVDGVIVYEQVEEQAYVTRGTKLVLFEDTSKAEIECNLRIDQLQTILMNATQSRSPYELPRNEVKIEYQWGEGEPIKWDGQLARTNGIGLDEKTRTVPCLIEVEKPVNEESRGLKTLVRGMFVKAKIQVPAKETLLRIPAESLQGKRSVWVVQDGKLKQTEVTRVSVSQPEAAADIAGKAPQYVVVQQIDSDLEPGALVVTSPVTYETEDQAVQVQTASNRSGGSAKSQPMVESSSQQGGEDQ